jgi:hypothetical protein
MFKHNIIIFNNNFYNVYRTFINNILVINILRQKNH